jgi:hypothetical protein
VKEFKFFSIKGPGPFQRGDNHKNGKMGVGSFKNLLPKNYEARKAEFYLKAFLHLRRQVD